jgi:hypothetical protein
VSLLCGTLEAALSDASLADRRTVALTAKLQKHWDDLSNMIVDRDQEKPQLKPGTFKPKQCHDLGICVCGSGQQAPPTLCFSILGLF